MLVDFGRVGAPCQGEFDQAYEQPALPTKCKSQLTKSHHKMATLLE